MNNNKKTKNKFLNGLLTATSLASIMLGATSASGAEAVTNGAAILEPAAGGGATGFLAAWNDGDSIKSGGGFTIGTTDGAGIAYDLTIGSIDTNGQSNALTSFSLSNPGVGNTGKVTIGSIVNSDMANIAVNKTQNITFTTEDSTTLVLNGGAPVGVAKNDYSALGKITFANKKATLQVIADDNGGDHNIIFGCVAADNTTAKVASASKATLEVGGVTGLGVGENQTNLIVQSGTFGTFGNIMINPTSQLIFDGADTGGEIILNVSDNVADATKGIFFGGNAGNDSGTLILKTKDGAGVAEYSVLYGSIGGKTKPGVLTDLLGNITFDVSAEDGSLKTSNGRGGVRNEAIIGIDNAHRANLFTVITGIKTAEIQGKIYAKNLVFDGGAAGAAEFESIVDTGLNGTTTFKTGPVALTFAQKATLGTIATDAGAQTSTLKFTAGGSLSGSTDADPAVTISTISNNAAEEITVGGNLTVTDDGLEFLVANGTFKIADGAVITADVTTTAAGNLTFIESGKLIGNVAAGTALTTLNFTATGGEANVEFDGTVNSDATIFTTNGTNAIFNSDAALGMVSGATIGDSTLTFRAGNSSLNINNAGRTVKKITLIGNGKVEFQGSKAKTLTLTDGLAFKSAGGTVELGAGVLLEGNVTNINPTTRNGITTPSGILKINAIDNSVNGSIGAANARLAELKFFTNAGTATFTPVTGSIYTMATEFNTTNTQNYTFNNITDLGTITTAGGGQTSTLEFNAGGSLSGAVGGTTIGKITNNTVNTVTIGGNITPTNGLIASNAGAVFSLENNTTITGNVDNSTGAAGGTLKFLGNGTVTGSVGDTHAYNLVQVGSGVAEIGGTLNSVNINFTDVAGSLKISDAAIISGGVTGGHGTMIFGDAGTVTSASHVGEVQVGSQNVTFSNTLRTNGDVKFNNNGKSLTITGLATIGGNVIDANANNKLILKAGGTVTGNIQGLDELKFDSAAAATFTVNGNTVTAKTIFDSNGTNATFNGDATLGIVSGANLADSTLTFGGAGNSSLNTGAGAIALSSISNNGTGTVSLQGGNTITSSLRFTNAGTIAIENNTNFTGNATTSIAGQGVLNFLGTSNFAGNIGAAGSAIGELKFSGAAGTVNVIGTVDTEKTSLYDNFNLNFQNKTALKKVTTTNNGTKSIIQFTNVGSLQGDNTTLKQILNNNGNVVTIAGSWFGSEKNTALLLLNHVDSEFNLSDNISIEGSVQTAVDNQGTLYFSGNGKITGNIGKNTEKLAKVTVTQGTVELSGVYAKILHFEKAALIKIVAAGTIDGAVTTSANGVGTLSFLGTNSTISGNIGENFRGLDEVIVTNGLTVGTATANVAELYAKKLTLGGTLDLASNSNNSNIVVINNVNVTKDAVLSQNITSTVNESLNLGTHSLTFNGSSEWGKDSSEFTIYTTLSNDNTLGKLIINAPVTTNDKVPLEINVTDTAPLGNKELLFIEVGKPNNLNEGKTVDFPLGGNIVSNQRYAGYVITKNANGNYYLGVKDDSTEKIIEDLTAANATDLQKENALLIANATTGNARATRDDLGRQNPKDAAEAIERLEEGAPIQTTDNVLSQTTLAVDYLISNRVSEVSIPNVGDNLNSKPVASGDEVRTPMGVWVQPLYIQSTQTTSTNVSGYTSKSTGGVFGLDTMANEDFIVGGAFSLIKTTMKFDGVKQGDKNTINSLGVSFYADQKLPRNFSIQAIAGFGSSKVQTSSKRLVSKEIDASGSQTASGKYNSRYYGGQVMVTYGAKISDTMLFTPQAGLSYSAFSNSSYTETGTTTQNLIVRNTKGSNNIQGIIGGRVQLFHNTNEFLLTPEMHAFLYQSLRSNQGTVSSQLSGMNSAFITAPSKINTLLNVGFSLNAKHQQMDYSIGYDLITASKGYKANAANLKVRINF